jgi:uncharacterized protein YdaU (DUF1376 family)
MERTMSDQQSQVVKEQPRRTARERRSQSDHPGCFPFYYQDHLMDPNRSALSWEERARYDHAWMTSWGTSTPGVAPEDQWRRWMQYSEREWPRRREAFSRCFVVKSDGTWIQKRVRKERDAQKNRFRAASEAGKTSARNRRARSDMTRVVTRDVGTDVVRAPQPYPVPVPDPVTETPGRASSVGLRPAPATRPDTAGPHGQTISEIIGAVAGARSLRQ